MSVFRIYQSYKLIRMYSGVHGEFEYHLCILALGTNIDSPTLNYYTCVMYT